MRDAELRAVASRVFFWAFLLAGVAAAFLWFASERRAVSASGQVVVGQAQPLPEVPFTRGRLP